MSNKPLTRRQSEVLRHILSGGKVCAMYDGGPASDFDNWDFAMWMGGGYIDGCPIAARALLRMGIVKIGDRDSLGYQFLQPAQQAAA